MVRLKFRHRVGLLVVLAAFALAVITGVTLFLGRRAERQLTGIETRYVPLIELDRDLKRLAADISKTLENAAAAGEASQLADADKLEATFLQRLHAGSQTIADNGSDPNVVREKLEAYYKKARELSAALVDGTPPAQLVDSIEQMRLFQRDFALALETATSPDRNKLAAAFATARESQNESLLIDIAVACIAFVAMAFLSWRMIRRTVQSLQAVSDGVERLARGDFAHAIDVPPGDEIGDLAREANHTAARLRELREEADRETARAQAQLLETQRQALAAETANKELESFSYSVSHDLRAPLRGIDGFSQALVEDEAERLSSRGQNYLQRIRAAAQRMAELIDDLLRLSRVSRADFRKEQVDLSALVTTVANELRKANPDRNVELVVKPNVTANADARLIRITLENLLGNAWKFTSKAEAARVEFGTRDEDGNLVYFVRDNGAGFDMKYADKLFGAFQRLHTDKEFPGTGIGLATVQRIVLRHGGRIWVDAAVGSGATFQFTLPS